MPAEGVKLEGEAVWKPGPKGVALWRYWLDMCATVKTRLEETGANLVLLINGDLTDGRVFRDQDLVDIDLSSQVKVALTCLAPLVALKPRKVFVTRGTPVHVGPKGSLENAIARSIGAEVHPETKTRSGYKWNLECYGRKILAAHHPPSAGRLPRTRKSQQVLNANTVANLYWERGLECPDFVFWSHIHEPCDTGPAMPHRTEPRVIVLGPWQRRTQYAHRVAGNAMGQEHHACLLTIWPDRNRTPYVEHLMYPKRYKLTEVKV